MVKDPSIPEIVPYNFTDIYEDISAKFKDHGYDVAPGSNISQLVTSMAYATSMLNANTAMNVNEMILSNANRKENVLASARNLGYEAKHKVSYVYKLTLKSRNGTFIIPKYSVFTQGDRQYVYTGKQIEVYGKPDEVLSITVKEGKVYKYTDSETLHVFIGKIEDSAGNIVPQYYIDIPFVNVEEDGIEVLCTYMDEYGVLHEKEVWEQAPSLHIEIDQDPDVRQFFRIDNIEYGTPRIYFRYSGIGKSLQLGTEVFINVLESSGANGELDLTELSNISTSVKNVSVVAASLVSAGANEEDSSDIKVNAPKLYNSSNRLVVAQDYIAACKRDQRVKNCVVWGGEDEFPKAPGHIWFSFLPPGTHNFTHNDSYTKWTRDNVSYEWEYGLVNPEQQLSLRDDYYRFNYIPESSIRSPYRNDDGSVANPGIWDRLDSLKIPTLVYHHRAPIYLEYSYQIEVAKYLAYDSKSSMHTDMFNIIDTVFSGVGNELQYEDFSIQYFNTNLIKRIDERATDQSGFNMELETKLVLNSKCLAVENLEPEYKDIYIPLAVPFESYFDSSGYLLIDRLPNIDTPDFVKYNDEQGGKIYTDWTLVRNDIENGKRQQGHKIIYAPIKVLNSWEYSFEDRLSVPKILVPFEIQPDDYLQTGEPDKQFTFNNTTVMLINTDTDECTDLYYGKDWYWDPDEPTVIRLADTEHAGGDVLRIKAEAQAGWYYLFNSGKKEIMVHLFVDGTRSGFSISLAGDWSKDPSADLTERYLYTYDDYYGTSEDSYYHYTDALTVDNLSDNWTSDEASLRSDDSYVETTGTQPRAFLTTLDGGTLSSLDRWYLTTNGYVIFNEEDKNSYTGPIVKEINKYMYIRSPLKYDLFDRNRYLNLKYLSGNFEVIRNVIPVLKTVEFFSLSDSGAQNNNYIDITLALQGGELPDTLIRVDRGITFETLKKKLQDPTKPYCKFRWWSLESFGAQISDETKFTKNSTIYAVWKTLTADISINAGDGTVVPDHLNVKLGTTIGSVEDAIKCSRDGYVFDGLSTEVDGERIPRSNIVLGDMSVHVKWADDKIIRIEFNTNGGSVQDALEVDAGLSWNQVKDRVQVPVKDGFVFAGWYLDSTLTDRVQDDTKFSTDVTVFAKYEERLMEISFNANGGRPIPPMQKVRKGTLWKVVKAKLKQPYKAGSLFLGWSLHNDADLRDFINDEYKFVDYESTVYALYNDKISTIRFIMNGGAPEVPYQIVEQGTLYSDLTIQEPKRNNFKFLGWSLSPDGDVIDDTFMFNNIAYTLYAVWQYDGCVLNFNTSYGSEMKPIKVARGTKWLDIRYTITTPVRQFYEFNYWSIAPDGEPVDDSFMFDDDTYTLYAIWTYNGSKLVFHTQGGSNIKPVTVVKGTTWKDIKANVDDPFKDSEVFKHWSLTPDGEQISDQEVFNDDIEPIYAVWA